MVEAVQTTGDIHMASEVMLPIILTERGREIASKKNPKGQILWTEVIEHLLLPHGD